MGEQTRNPENTPFTAGGYSSSLLEDRTVSLGNGVSPNDVKQIFDGFCSFEPRLTTIGGIELTSRLESFSGTNFSQSSTPNIDRISLVRFEGRVDNFNQKYSYSENHGNVRYEITFERGSESKGSVSVNTKKSVDGIVVQDGSYQFQRSGAVTEKVPVERNLATLENTFEREFAEVSKRALFQLANHKGDEGVAMTYTDQYQPPPAYFSDRTFSGIALIALILAASGLPLFASWKRRKSIK